MMKIGQHLIPVAGPVAWYALPPELRNATSRTMFYHILKLTCTIIILTTYYKFLSFCYVCCTDDVLQILWYF